MCKIDSPPYKGGNTGGNYYDSTRKVNRGNRTGYY